MISRIYGKIAAIKDGVIILNVGGMSYEILVLIAVMKALRKTVEDRGSNPGIGGENDNRILGEHVELITYHYYQMEPSRAIPVLIGFQNEIEREFFEKFITVSGVGPKAACRALAEPFSIIAGAIDNGDDIFLKSLPGIGEQRAKLIIAKLQGKVGKYGLIRDETLTVKDGSGDIVNEAVEVLLQLQYKRNEAVEMVKKALQRKTGIKTSEELLNEVYRERKK